jgi:hypothetical protein
MRTVRTAVVLATACRSTPPPSPPPANGSAVAPPTCRLDGAYRIRYRSNNADGWWLRLSITRGAARLTAEDAMDVLPAGPLATTIDGCKATIRGTNEHSGDVVVAFVLDPARETLTGTLSRTRYGEGSSGADTTPIVGRRDVGPLSPHACLVAGNYELSIGSAASWKLVQGQPRIGNCNAFADGAVARVRIEPFGDELVVVEVNDHGVQSFGRAKAVLTGDCDATLALAFDDFAVDGTLHFEGSGAITGSAATARYQFMENGTLGENQWACATAHAPIVAKRMPE